MNRALPSFVKFVSIAALAFASIASASENKAQPAADANKGGTLYANGDASRGITACVACHGNAGNSTITQNPKLAGQHEAYLQKQQPGAAKNKNTVEFGKKIYRAGIAEKNLPACAGCHGPNGAGIPAQFARIAGQHQDYTVAQLSNFRNGTRANSAQMTAVGKRMSDEEMQAVADYIAGLK